MLVWDENYKNLHVIFKDYVEELNDETIVFMSRVTVGYAFRI